MKILNYWGIIDIPEYIGLSITENIKVNSPIQWTPPYCTYKLNFNKDSKGNIGTTGFGGATKDKEGKIKGIFWCSPSLSTNNATNLEGLLVVLI